MTTPADLMADGKTLAQAEAEAPYILMKMSKDTLQPVAKSEVNFNSKPLYTVEEEAAGIIMEMHREDAELRVAPAKKRRQKRKANRKKQARNVTPNPSGLSGPELLAKNADAEMALKSVSITESQNPNAGTPNHGETQSANGVRALANMAWP